jgi:hypothetical protein
MQCKHIPDVPILRFLNGEVDGYEGWPVRGWGTWFKGSFPNSVLRAMPDGVPEKLALAKMGMLIRRGLVDGCPCGCRGDFEITAKGEAVLEAEVG